MWNARLNQFVGFVRLDQEVIDKPTLIMGQAENFDIDIL